MIVAIDGSEQSLRAAENAIVLAEKSDAHVYVVYVIDRSISKTEVMQTWDFLGITEKKRKMFKRVEKAAENGRISYEVKFIRGEPAVAIINFAEEMDADLIVIGSRGLSQFQQLVLGSVSHKVVKKATCPVLIVK